MPRKQSKAGQPGIYNLVLPTFNDGEGGALAIDASGRLITAGMSSASQGATAGTGLSISGGVYNSTPPTLSNGQASQLQLDQNGNTKVTLATLSAGEDLTNNWQYVNTNNARRFTIQASAAQTSSNNSALASVGNYREAIITLNVTAVSGATPTLNVKIQTSDDGGSTWFDLPGAAFTAATAATSQAIQITNFGDTIRAVSTIAGTTPSFTYAIKAVGK